MAKMERYIRKNVDLFSLLDKIRLWPSRKGVLHGIKSIQRNGEYALVTTFCGEIIKLRNSKSSRVARWLRNKWVVKACPVCKVPKWKIEKYSETNFQSHYGSDLKSQKDFSG